MNEAHAKALETRKRNEQARKELRERERAEMAAHAAALRQIRDNPDATPGVRLEAVKLLRELENKGYLYL